MANDKKCPFSSKAHSGTSNRDWWRHVRAGGAGGTSGMRKTSACVFCDIMAGRAPADVVYRDDLTIAIIDPRQHNPGHVLVIPGAHVNDIKALDERTLEHERS